LDTFLGRAPLAEDDVAAGKPGDVRYGRNALAVLGVEAAEDRRAGEQIQRAGEHATDHRRDNRASNLFSPLCLG
jgi:hypothetical protein